MFGIGPIEIMVIVLVILLLFGGNELPRIVKSLIKGWHQIQRTTQNVKDELHEIIEDDDLVG